jgi:hypothetical protein
MMATKEKRVPKGVAREALRVGQEIVASQRNILSVGLGHKYARAVGYGDSAVPCVKFAVDRKLKRPGAALKVPLVLTVDYRGRAYDLPTDIVEVGKAVQHQPPIPPAPWVGIRFNAHTKPHAPGTPGFLVRSHAQPGFMLVTAGHVAYDKTGTTNPMHPHPPPAFMDPDGDFTGDFLLGSVVPKLTYRARTLPSGPAFVDVGVVRLPGIPDHLKRPPWSIMKRTLTFEELGAWNSTPGAFRFYRKYSANGIAGAQFDSSWDKLFPVPSLGLTYAPILVVSRALPGQPPFKGGDSGAALMTDDGILVGIHVVGRDSEPNLSFSVFAGTILQYLKTLTGDATLEILTM